MTVLLLDLELGRTRQLERYTEEGAIDLARRNYSTTLNHGQAGGRAVAAAARPAFGHGSLAAKPPSKFAAAPETTQFTNPPAIVDGLVAIRRSMGASQAGDSRSVRFAT